MTWIGKSRRRGIKTLAETCQKTGCQVHAYWLIIAGELQRLGWK